MCLSSLLKSMIRSTKFQGINPILNDQWINHQLIVPSPSDDLFVWASVLQRKKRILSINRTSESFRSSNSHKREWLIALEPEFLSGRGQQIKVLTEQKPPAVSLIKMKVKMHHGAHKSWPVCVYQKAKNMNNSVTFSTVYQIKWK